MLSLNMPIDGHEADVTSNTVVIAPLAGTITLNIDDDALLAATHGNFRTTVAKVLPRAARKLAREGGATTLLMTFKVSINDHEGDITVANATQVLGSTEVELQIATTVFDSPAAMESANFALACKILRRAATDAAIAA